MYSPDDIEIKEVPKRSVKNRNYPKVPPEGLILLSEQEIFNYYLDNSLKTRERYGVAKSRDGKFYITELPVIEKLDGSLKNLLREWVRQKKLQGKWDSDERKSV